VPVIDLRRKLGLPPKEATAESRILVLDVPLDDREFALGLIADRVIEVTALDEGSLSSAPQIGTRWRSDYIRGIGRRNGGFVVVFDLTRLLASDAAALLQAPDARIEAPAEEALSCA
jgi:purine-binding chemotaxis protein CheW